MLPIYIDDSYVLPKFRRGKSGCKVQPLISILSLKDTTPSPQVDSLRPIPLSRPPILSNEKKVWWTKSIIVTPLIVLRTDISVMNSPPIARQQDRLVSYPTTLLA